MCKHSIESEFANGPEFYNEVGRLIAAWWGSDAAEQVSTLDALVADIVKLTKIRQDLVSFAAHGVSKAA